MPRGRKPDGPQALSGAERQARYRAHHPGTAIRRFRRPADRRSRPQRWHTAVAELVALQADYARWLDAIPDATRDGATAEALREHSTRPAAGAGQGAGRRRQRCWA